MRARRHAASLSQAALAERLGITFQQIQKYESSANRISAALFVDIARALTVPLDVLIPCGAPKPAAPVAHRDAASLLEAFVAIKVTSGAPASA